MCIICLYEDINECMHMYMDVCILDAGKCYDVVLVLTGVSVCILCALESVCTLFYLFRTSTLSKNAINCALINKKCIFFCSFCCCRKQKI